MPQPLMVVTDLDGTLLDHHDYSFQAALPMLGRLRDDGVPVVLCSSKTPTEITRLQDELGLSGSPFVAENGAVVVDADGARLIDPTPDARDLLRATVLRLRDELGLSFETFSEATDAMVSSWTGLDVSAAAAARHREASEVLRWSDAADALDALGAFRAGLAAAGFELSQGGRFRHVLPEGRDKGAAVRLLVADQVRRTGTAPRTIGLGDGWNDTPLLDAVDLAVVVRGFGPPPGTLADDRPERVHRTTETGPRGWTEGLTHFIDGPTDPTRSDA